MNIELLHDLLPVLFDGLYAQAKLSGNLFVGVTLGDQLQDFRLALSQFDWRFFGPLLLVLDGLLAQALRNGRAEEGVALSDLADGGDNVLGGGLLEQVSGSAGGERLLDMFVIPVGREHNDFSGGRSFEDLARRLGAIEARHGQVHDDNPGMELSGQSYRFPTGLGFTDDSNVLLTEQQSLETLANDGVVIYEQNGCF